MMKDSEYKQIANHNIDTELIPGNQEKKLDWTKILYDHNIAIDSQSFQKWDRNMEIQGQQTLQKDIPRTRSTEPQMKKQVFRDVLRRIATFYCKQNRVCYQQGLLEVIYPFALLRSRTFSTKKCYAYFNAFMRNFFPKVLTMKKVKNKKQLPHAILALTLTDCLLKFHEPQIYFIFKNQDIPLSMVATQELMTIFAKSLDINYVYEIYDYFIKKKNPNYLFFMCVALVARKKSIIIEASKNGSVHSIIPKIKDFKTSQDLQQWLQQSNFLVQKTPQSFFKIFDQYGFSNRNILTSQDLQDMVQSQKLFPKDYLYIEINQINKKTENYIFVVVQNKLSGTKHNYRSITVKEIQKKEENQFDSTKIYVLGMRQGKKQEDMEALLEAIDKLKFFKIAILSTQLCEKNQKCQIF